jgi:serine/threonine protein kinase
LLFQINAKIADYGISRFAAPYGFSSKEGTPGFRAPEVARGETYEFQADIYSYGITLYTLVTGGHHPFRDLTFRNQLDEAVTRVSFPDQMSWFGFMFTKSAYFILLGNGYLQCGTDIVCFTCISCF